MQAWGEYKGIKPAQKEREKPGLSAPEWLFQDVELDEEEQTARG